MNNPKDPRNELMILAAEVVPKIKRLNQEIETILDTFGDDDDAIATYLSGFCINGKKDPYLEFYAKSLQGFTDLEPDDLSTPTTPQGLIALMPFDFPPETAIAAR